MKLAIAADHGGYELKEEIKQYLTDKGYEIIDLGTNSCEAVDYPEYGKRCAEAVVGGEANLGIVFCGTGIGISIAANKVKGARCALCTSEEMAELTRLHNDSNMLALGGRTVSLADAKKITDKWLTTEFSGEERHQRRVDQLNEMG